VSVMDSSYKPTPPPGFAANNSGNFGAQAIGVVGAAPVSIGIKKVSSDEPPTSTGITPEERKFLHRKSHSVTDLVHEYERKSSPKVAEATMGQTVALNKQMSASKELTTTISKPVDLSAIPSDNLLTEYKQKCENLEKRVDELEKLTSKLINEGQLWRYRAKRNKALYVQIFKALAEEGITVQVEGDRAELSDDDEVISVDSPRSFDEKRSLEERPLLQPTETADIVEQWFSPKSPKSATSRAHKSSTVGRSHGKPNDLDAMALSYATMKQKKVSKADMKLDPGEPSVTASATVVSAQEDELPENGANLNEDDLALAVVAENLRQTRNNLPKVSGYLQKKSPTMLRGWQKRFFWVKDFKLFYAPNEVDTNSIVEDEKMTEKGWNAISLVTVHSISAKSEDGEFQIRARDPRTGQMRNYGLKADSNSERDRWVRDLNTHRDHLLTTLRWAGA
jgi:hypothetical protein